MVTLTQVFLLLHCGCWLSASQRTICSEERVCVVSESGKEHECPQNTEDPVYSLSNVVISCKTARIYLTSGTHRITEPLTFTFGKSTIIDSVGNSKIVCYNFAGIKFVNDKYLQQRIYIYNLAFSQCEIHFTFVSYYLLHNVTVVDSRRYGVYSSESEMQKITRCTFNNNTRGHIIIESYEIPRPINVTFRETVLYKCAKGYAAFVNINYISNADVNITISDCFVENNKGIVITVEAKTLLVNIDNVSFTNNLGALHMNFAPEYRQGYGYYARTKIRACTFYNHTQESQKDGQCVVAVSSSNIFTPPVVIENCIFNKTKRLSALCFTNMPKITLNNVHLHDIDCNGLAICSGININSSMVKIMNHLTITESSGIQGGAISLSNGRQYSQLVLDDSSLVNIINNTALSFGGGIYIDKTCHQGSESQPCFFQFSLDTKNISPKFFFSGNTADSGGDSVFGGCLSNCSVQINGTRFTVNKTDPHNIFQTLFTYDVQSQSTFVEQPTRPVFCTNTSSAIDANSSAPTIISNNSHSVSVFRGQIFNISIIAADDLGYPTYKILKTKWEREVTVLLQEKVIETRKYCSNYSYAIAGVLNRNETDIQFLFENALHRDAPLAVLMINLEDCPSGLKLNSTSEKCNCNRGFSSHKIVCHSDTYTLEIPALTWVGVHKGEIVAQRECLYCKSKNSLESLGDITDKMCAGKRSGVMCGQCIEGYSLKLGGYKCASCPKSPLVSIILVIIFAVAGVILVVLLLRLDLTISTGVINGFIFYTNIIYLNGDTFLPTSSIEGSNTHLVTAVRILSALQAWMNLDFGIDTCFFRGYNTYIGTWMQFVFPLYIWLLISVIVLASRYSTIVARVTTSNTVPVLATLLLLSYSKLLKTSIEVFSPVHLFSLDGEAVEIVWKQDGNIPYLGGLHLPLFLMSLLMVVAYILPFTFLVFLGPFIRSKSHYRLFRWYHSVKPFFDAFFGCYVNRYRYWPGILLLTRVVIIGIFALYSNNAPFKLVTINVMVLVLFILSLVIIGKIETIAFYRKRKFNYLELFFLTNLGITAAGTVYTSQFTAEALRNQQLLAVVMVGSAMLLFCGIIAYHVYLVAMQIRVIRRFITSKYEKLGQLVRRKHGGPEPFPLQRQPEGLSNNSAVGVTHTEIHLKDNQLRESLLTGN